MVIRKGGVVRKSRSEGEIVRGWTEKKKKAERVTSLACTYDFIIHACVLHNVERRAVSLSELSFCARRQSTRRNV